MHDDLQTLQYTLCLHANLAAGKWGDRKRAFARAALHRGTMGDEGGDSLLWRATHRVVDDSFRELTIAYVRLLLRPDPSLDFTAPIYTASHGAYLHGRMFRVFDRHSFHRHEMQLQLG